MAPVKMISWIGSVADSGNDVKYIIYISVSFLFVSLIYASVTVGNFVLVIYLIYLHTKSKHKVYFIFHFFIVLDMNYIILLFRVG
jgi:hypothetical protein